MNKIIKIAFVAGVGYLVFTAGRVYEVGHLIVKVVKFISNLPALEEDSKEAKETEKEDTDDIVVSLTRDEYHLLNDAAHLIEKM